MNFSDGTALKIMICFCVKSAYLLWIFLQHFETWTLGSSSSIWKNCSHLCKILRFQSDSCSRTQRNSMLLKWDVMIPEEYFHYGRVVLRKSHVISFSWLCHTKNLFFYAVIRIQVNSNWNDVIVNNGMHIFNIWAKSGDKSSPG